ncbi:14158_t:CDS:2 [Entrophospora sp. SA101]|nr:14158_t:CDS:2 [Entrophospora sp. SA101]
MLECYKNYILSNLNPARNYVEFYKLTKTLEKLALLCDDKNDGSCEGENSTDDEYND